MDIPLDICTGTLDESLLCTPSRGIMDIEPMSIDSGLPAISNNNDTSPALEPDMPATAKTSINTIIVDKNLTAKTNNTTNTLTKEQPVSLKHKLSELIHQASTLITIEELDKANNNPSDVALVGREQEVPLTPQKRQLAARPKIGDRTHESTATRTAMGSPAETKCP